MRSTTSITRAVDWLACRPADDETPASFKGDQMDGDFDVRQR